MPIGAAWNIDDPTKPWIDWDPQANIRIPIGVADWLTELGDTYASHDVIATPPLECADEGAHVAQRGGGVGRRIPGALTGVLVDALADG